MVGIRGETVGTAYVRILADGSELGDGIKDEMRQHEDAFKAAGRRDGKIYRDAFDESLSKVPQSSSLTEALHKSIADADATRMFFSEAQWKDLETEIHQRYGHVGEVATASLEAEFRRKGSLDGMVEAVENLGPRIERATQKIMDDEKKVIEQAKKDVDGFERAWRQDFDRISKDTSNSIRTIRTEFEKMDDTIAKINSTSKTMILEQSRGWEEVDKKFQLSLRDIERLNKEVDKSSPIFTRAGHRIEGMSVSIGRLFGKGSRNNFLNFFGSVIANILHVGGKILSFVGAVGNAVGTFFRTMSTDLEENNKLWTRLGVSITTAIGAGTAETVATAGLNIVVSLIAMAGAIGLVIFSAGTLISVLILLSGAIIALGATISFALVGAVAALGGAILPLAALLGGTILAITQLDDAGGAVEKQFKNIKNSAKDLRDVFTHAAFKGIAKQFKIVNEVLKRTKPLVRSVGDGLRRAFIEVIDDLDSPAFNKFLEDFTTFLPRAMESLGRSTGNFFTGMSGLLRGMRPLIMDFLHWIEDLTQRFSDFTNSGKGQHAIKEFFNDAKQSAEALGDFLIQLGGLIKDLFTAGQDTGDSIFTSMADGLRDIRDWLKANPDAVANFFKDSKEFALDLGHAIRDIAKAIRQIDTPQTRAAAKGLIKAFGGFFLLTADIVSAFIWMAHQIINILGIIVSATLVTFSKILHGMAIFEGPWSHTLKDASAEFDDFAEGVIAKFGDIDHGLDAVETAFDQFNPSLDVNITPAMQKLQNLEDRIRSINNIRVGAGGQSGPPPPAPDTPPHQHGHGHQNDRTVQVGGVTIMTTTADPAAVASEVINKLVAFGY